jgi:hypothetical protein
MRFPPNAYRKYLETAEVSRIFWLSVCIASKLLSVLRWMSIHCHLLIDCALMSQQRREREKQEEEDLAAAEEFDGDDF